MENGERGDFKPCTEECEDENEDNDAAVGIEAKYAEELQNAFEKRIAFECLEEAKNASNGDELRSKADAD